jgi:hypothetical protein
MRWGRHERDVGKVETREALAAQRAREDASLRLDGLIED